MIHTLRFDTSEEALTYIYTESQKMKDNGDGTVTYTFKRPGAKKAEPPKKELPATPKEPDPEPKKAEDPKAWVAGAEKAAAESVDPTEVKIFLSNLLRAGHKDEVKALLTKYGVKKLTELIDDKADQLAAFYAEAKEIK